MKRILIGVCLLLGVLSAQVFENKNGLVSTWKTYAFSNAAFIVASTTATITVATLPANTVVDKVYLKHSTAIAGTGITAATCSLGVSGDTDFYLSPGDVFTAATATLNYSAGGSRQYSTASHDLLLTCVANTNWGNGSATVATAGALTVGIAYSTIQ